MRRSFISLLTALTFSVMAVTGVLAFVRVFSIQIVGLHALMGFVFIILVGLHVMNNVAPLKKYLRSKILWLSILIISVIAGVFFLQSQPVKAVLKLSGNLGPALERFEMNEDGMVFHYSPDPAYKMKLTVKAGKAFDRENPPRIAIWLENQSAYHIKTLLTCDTADGEEMLPYWSYKVREFKKAKGEAEEAGDVLAVSEPTRNSSFDPADYILPADIENPMPYQLLIEINQAGDAHGSFEDQPSLVYSVEIDNLRPKFFQLFGIEGSPKHDDSNGEDAWAVYYVDEGLGSALNLIDSALLTIERSER